MVDVDADAEHRRRGTSTCFRAYHMSFRPDFAAYGQLSDKYGRRDIQIELSRRRRLSVKNRRLSFGGKTPHSKILVHRHIDNMRQLCAVDTVSVKSGRRRFLDGSILRGRRPCLSKSRD